MIVICFILLQLGRKLIKAQSQEQSKVEMAIQVIICFRQQITPSNLVTTSFLPSVSLAGVGADSQDTCV